MVESAVERSAVRKQQAILPAIDRENAIDPFLFTNRLKIPDERVRVLPGIRVSDHSVDVTGMQSSDISPVIASDQLDSRYTPECLANDDGLSAGDVGNEESHRESKVQIQVMFLIVRSVVAAVPPVAVRIGVHTFRWNGRLCWSIHR